MWWFFRKVKENTELIIYNYGYESYTTTGTFEYNKSTENVNVIRYADNHSKSYNFNTTVLKLIEKYHAPEERMIAYG